MTPKIQYHITLPDNVKSNAYDVITEFDFLGQKTVSAYECCFERGISQKQKAEALVAFLKELTETLLFFQILVATGVYNIPDNLTDSQGEDDGFQIPY